MKTLKQVTDLVGMTRRVIQEYEKAGLTKTPTTTDKYGHLLYDEATIERLWQIRFYRELEYDKEQIRKAFTDPSYNKHDAIADQIVKLEEKRRKLEAMIEVARTYNEMDILPSDIWTGQNGVLEALPYDINVAAATKIFSSIDRFAEQIDWEQEISEGCWEEILVDWPTRKAENQWMTALKKIESYYLNGFSYKSTDVQKQISIMQSIDAEIIQGSIIKSWLRTYTYATAIIDCEDSINEAFRKNGTQYITDAVAFYCYGQWMEYVKNINCFGKTTFWKTIDNFKNYGMKRFTTGSKEVQNEVKKLHRMIMDVGVFSEGTQIKLLELFSALLDSQEVKDALENGRGKGICWFISRAIQIYCNHQQESMEKEKESNE